MKFLSALLIASAACTVSAKVVVNDYIKDNKMAAAATVAAACIACDLLEDEVKRSEKEDSMKAEITDNMVTALVIASIKCAATGKEIDLFRVGANGCAGWAADQLAKSAYAKLKDASIGGRFFNKNTVRAAAGEAMDMLLEHVLEGKKEEAKAVEVAAPAA